MKLIKEKLLLTILFIVVQIAAHANVTEVLSTDSLPPFHLEADSCVINFNVDDRYIFIDGSIGNTKGKFMFDTGSGAGLSINRLYVKDTEGKKIGTGFNGSGSKYDVFRLDSVKNIKIGNDLTFAVCGPVFTDEQKVLQEHYMPDLLGLIGYDFFKGYILKVDYRSHKLTFYKNTAARSKNRDFLNGEKVINEITLKSSLLPNHPLTDIMIDGVLVEAGFDTGTPGVLYPTDSLKEKLSAKGLLTAKDAMGEAILKDLLFSNGFKAHSSQVHILSPAAGNGIRKAIGFKEDNILELGHGFLSQYKTVWDIEHNKMYLLNP